MKNTRVTIGIGLALLITVLVAIPLHAQGVYVTPPQCWWYWQTNASYVVLYNYGSESYTIILMTPSEYDAMYHDMSTYAIGEWGIQPQSSLAIQVPSSDDYIVMVPSTGSCQGEPTLYMYYGYGAPIGVSSLEPASTNEVLGYFNITNINAYNPNGESQFNVPNSGASLQLNAVLEVQLADGTTQYYWLQDVVQFRTSSGEYNLVDNVWNDTSSGSPLSNATITGYGSVSPSPKGYYYSYGTTLQAYSLPFAGYLLIKLVSTNPLEVSFCYVIIQSGSQYYPPSFNCYDTVTINTPEPVSTAAIVTNPNTITPSGNAIDAELVFGGYGSGEYTTFNSLNAYLALLYWGNGAWKPYGDLFMNGWDTMEAATDLISEISPNIFIYVTTGSLLSSGSTLLANTIAMPSLPMTYVSVTNPATGESWSGYVMTTTSYSFPTVVSVGSGTEYVLTSVTVNGAAQSSSTVTITPSSNFASFNIAANYKTYYLVTVSSPVPVTVKTYNETETTTAFTEWVPSGSAISIYVNSMYTFNNGTRLIYLGSNETETVNQPLSISIPATSFQRQYLVSIRSSLPVVVNGTFTTQYTAWLSPGSVLVVEPRTTMFSGFFVSEPGYVVAVTKPITLFVAWQINWFLTITVYGSVIVIITVIAVVVVTRIRRRW